MIPVKDKFAVSHHENWQHGFFYQVWNVAKSSKLKAQSHLSTFFLIF
jgi:hypothetical protein